MATFDVQGKTFLITGGASGIGAEYVPKFLDQGAKGIAILDIAVAMGEALVQKYSAKYPEKIVFINCDMSKEEDIAKAFDAVVSKFTQIDVIINNAGIMVDAPKVWRTASNVNWEGVVSMTLKGIKHMSKLESGVGGTIVNIASIAALMKVPFLPIYSGAKMGVLHFSQCIAAGSFHQLTGVRVLCMCFGATNTALLNDVENKGYDSNMEKYGKDTDLTKYGKDLEAAKEAGRKMYVQKVESAVEAVDYMIKNGPNGSIWLSVDDKPAKNITPIIDEAFNTFQKALVS